MTIKHVEGDYGHRIEKKGKRASFPVCKTITITEGQTAKVARMAEERGITFSAMIRILVDEA